MLMHPIESDGHFLGLQTVTLLSHFLLMMMDHPEVVAKVQKEIDFVVGGDRLPTYDDCLSLPHLECVLSEFLRWAAANTLSVIHLPLLFR